MKIVMLRSKAYEDTRIDAPIQKRTRMYHKGKVYDVDSEIGILFVKARIAKAKGKGDIEDSEATDEGTGGGGSKATAKSG